MPKNRNNYILVDPIKSCPLIQLFTDVICFKSLTKEWDKCKEVRSLVGSDRRSRNQASPSAFAVGL